MLQNCDIFFRFMHNKIVKNDVKLVFFLLSSVLIGVINGIFGGGGGMLCVPILKMFLDLDDKKAHATTVLVMAIISVPTLIVYITTLPFCFSDTLWVTIGVLIGGFIGSKLLKKMSNQMLNILFILFMFLAGIKLIF